MDVWWVRHKGVFEHELAMLEANGFQPSVDENNKAKGRLVIEIRIRVLGEDRTGSIRYPTLYPYFRPSLCIPNLPASRHYNTASGEVCLLTRGTEHWQPGMNAADHIRNMLPEWESVCRNSYEDDRTAAEDNQAEPASAYIAPSPFRIILDSTWSFPESPYGKMNVATPGGWAAILDKKEGIGCVTQVLDGSDSDAMVAEISSPLQKWTQASVMTEIPAYWCRLPEEPKNMFMQRIRELHPEFASQIANKLRTQKKRVLLGICFPEEGPDGRYRDGWLFFFLQASRNNPVQIASIITVEYAGELDMFERIPELSPLRSKTVAVIGLGCIGAPSAIEFARAGIGELRLLDSDAVTPGTACRWPLGFMAAGISKMRAVARFLRTSYPYTRISEEHLKDLDGDIQVLLGNDAGLDGTFDQMDCLEKMLSGADLIYDATAEEGVNHLLSDLARQKNITYVSVSSRPGAWGGNVVRVSPNTKGCFLCYLHSLGNIVSEPPYDPAGDTLQPVGCGDVTFTGASFDVQEIALAGVRSSVASLCSGEKDAYPSLPSEVGILSLRKDGVAIFPSWETALLKRHPNCPNCSG